MATSTPPANFQVITAPIESTTTSSQQQPKRVILRLRVDEFEGEGQSWQQHVDAITAYLAWAGRSPSEYEEGKHFAHVEPFQAPELRQTTFHVVLDIDQHLVIELNLNNILHEVYHVRRGTDGTL